LFESHDKQLDLTVCPRHREMFGTRWRTCRKTCSIPTEWTTHKSSNPKGDRGITAVQSKGLHQLTGHLVPVGSRICKRCRAQLKVAIDSVGEPLPAPALTTTESSLPTAEATLPPQIVLSPPTDTVSIQSSDDNEVGTLSRNTKENDVRSGESSDSLVHAFSHMSIREDLSGSMESTESSDDPTASSNLTLRRSKLNDFLKVLARLI
ncbi:hypothetical protein QZH41_010176, partial [Actinostola sp. cb2023]